MKQLWRLTAVALCVTAASCGQAVTPASTADTTAPESAALQVGACVDTTVRLTGPRLEGVADSGSTVIYANGVSQVTYDVTPGITNSQIGDAVHLCLVSVSQNCPPGDERGKVYSAINNRTHESWTAPDSEHSCGGA